jgi:hypothetical protein
VESCGFPRTRRTVSPSSHPCSASGGATNFLLASALEPPTDLAADRQGRRAMRRTDVCHPIESRAPAPRAFPAPCAPCEAWTPHGVFGSVEWKYRGTLAFHDAQDRFGGSSHDTCTVHLSRFRLDAAAWALSSHGAVCDRASDTPVAELLPSSASPVFTGAACRRVSSPLGGLTRVGRPKNRRDRLPSTLVTGPRSERSGVPSIVRDPS